MDAAQWARVLGAAAKRANAMPDEASPAAVMVWTLAAMQEETRKIAGES